MPDRVHAEISGLREIRRDLISADKRYGPEIRKILKATAEIVASDARSTVPVGPALGGHVKNTFKAGSSGPSSVVRAGSKKNPYAGWLDFGGTISPKGTPINRQVKKLGRYIYPAIKRKLPVAVEYLQKEIADLILKGAK